MARDEAMLEGVAGDPSIALFRTYRWSRPTLSLGYFQSVARAEAEERWRGLPLVRRPTGGGAILHDHEVTYAVVIPEGHALARRAPALYQAVHSAIVGLLLEKDVRARRRGVSASAGDDRPFLCFRDRDAEDVVVGTGPAKVVGSAQRRKKGAVLQHGSLLLERSSFAPELPGIGDFWGGSDVEETDWEDELERRIPMALGLTRAGADWPDALTQRADELEKSFYQNDAWTRRR